MPAKEVIAGLARSYNSQTTNTWSCWSCASLTGARLRDDAGLLVMVGE
jgi:hypothetical protein